MERLLTALVPVRENLSVRVTDWRKSFLHGVCEFSASYAGAFPRGYLLTAVVVASAGYLYLLLFPCMVLASASGIYGAIAGEEMTWLHAITWLVVGALSALISYRLYRFRPALPTGKRLDRESCPELFKLITDLASHYRGIRIDRVVLSGDFGVDIIRTPHRAVPVMSTYTLLIGKPLLQTLSNRHFQCMLARRLGQFSMKYNRLGNWLYQLRDIWPLYCQQPQLHGIGFQAVAWYFSLYAPVYRAVTVPAAHQDELAADSYAMELFSDEEVLDMITTHMVCRLYLREKYWPVIRKYASVGQTLDKMHSGMAAVLRGGLQASTVNYWTEKTLAAKSSCDDDVPSLASRIDNIGFWNGQMGALTTVTAAGIYFGNTKQ